MDNSEIYCCVYSFTESNIKSHKFSELMYRIKDLLLIRKIIQKNRPGNCYKINFNQERMAYSLALIQMKDHRSKPMGKKNKH